MIVFLEYLTFFYQQFQSETRKILISLVEASARLLMGSREAPKLFEMIKEKFKERCCPNIDSKAIKTLTDMGYSSKQVITALRVRK